MDPYHYPDDGPIAFRREHDLGDVIREAIGWMRETAGVWISALVAISGPLYLVSALLTAFAFDGSAVVLATILDVIAGLLTSAAGFAILRLYRIGVVAPSIGEVWDESKAWVVPLILFWLVTVLFTLVAMIPFGIVFTIVSVTVGAVLPSTGAIVVMGVLMVVAAIAAMPYYALGIVSRVFDEDGAFDAYKRAAGLIASHRALATGTTFVVFAMVYFLVLIVAGAFGGMLIGLGESGVLQALGGIVTVLLISPAGLFGSVASTFLFESLVEREEGTLLDAEIAAIRDGVEAPEPERPVPAPVALPREMPDTRSFAQRQLDARRARDGEDTSDEAPSDAQPDAPGRDDAPERGGFRGGGFAGPE